MLKKLDEGYQLFHEYIKSLAKGDLDYFFDSINPKDKLVLENIDLPMHPNLLLHGLGQRSDTRISDVFTNGTMLVNSRLIISQPLTLLFTAIYSTHLAPEKLVSY